MASEIEIIVASHPRWLRMIRTVTQEFAAEMGCDPRERHDLALAVGEAVANVIKHSYRGNPDNKLSLTCREDGDSFEVEIRDRGEPFDPEATVTRAPDEIRVGGRGVYLMRAIMDEVQYQRDGDVNCVRMKKTLKLPA
jgi:serine/threonine-protein kinase RsbW